VADDVKVTDDLSVTDNDEKKRWEARLEGDLAGISAYLLGPGRIIFTHTEVDSAFEGRGIASRLVKTALDDAVARNLRITPRCPFVRAYVTRHSEYAPHVDMPAPAG
jgi:predicted GNAT family acetyltransferase